MACLTALLVAHLLRSTRAGLAAALIAAVHPLTTETVVHIAARGDLFVALFTLIGLREALRPKPRGPWIIVCVLSALLSKESGLILPVLLVLVDLIWISSESKARFAVRRFCQVHLWSIGALATWLVFRWRATGSLGHVRPVPP